VQIFSGGYNTHFACEGNVYYATNAIPL